MTAEQYDPFARGRWHVHVRTIEARDALRDRVFPLSTWSPAGAHGPLPLIGYSHHAAGSRLVASRLCEHLASHGYAVAALDHSEVVAAELAGRDGETAQARQARVDAVIASRVPDMQFLLDTILDSETLEVDAARIGLVGHSFGGWAVLATAEVDPRVRSLVAMGPGGSSNPRPGVLVLTLSFAWERDIPTLYLAGEDDVPIPLSAVEELFERTPGSKRMVVLRRADHQHFVDDVEGAHEAVRSMDFPADIAWMQKAMRPIGELSTAQQAHTFVHGLTLAHLDATLRESEAATRLLDGDVGAELAARGVEAYAERAGRRSTTAGA